MRLLALGDTFSSLPQGSQLIVSLIVIASVMAVGVAIYRFEVTNTRWVVLATVGGFFLVDLFYIHPEVWENVPSLFYWLAKPFWVGIPMFGAAWYLERRTDVSTIWTLVIAGIFGVVVLQLYYTVIPIPVVGGEPIQIGLIGNLTEGVGVHGVGLLAALGVVVAAMWITD